MADSCYNKFSMKSPARENKAVSPSGAHTLASWPGYRMGALPLVEHGGQMTYLLALGFMLIIHALWDSEMSPYDR